VVRSPPHLRRPLLHGTDLLRAVSVPSDLRGGWCVVLPLMSRSFSM
jgi:hypothetical protein